MTAKERRRWPVGAALVVALAALTGSDPGAGVAALAARGASLAAFDGRCIPAGCVAPSSNIPDILGRRALPAGRLARLGATPDLHHGLLGRQFPQSPGADRRLAGAIDIHVHSLPDSETWRIDAIDVAKLARERGMRGLVLKSHWESTAMLAYIVRKEVPGLEVFGGIGLSRAVGGVNAAAVEEMARVTGGFGRVVWMPTIESEHGVRAAGSNRPFVSVSRNGELLPEVRDVISVIAKNGLVLATGHSSGEEDLMLVAEGQRQGAQHMVVTHAMSRPIRMTLPQMQQAAKLGAFVEIVYVHSLTIPELRRTAVYSAADVAEAIRNVGPESVILSTDMGQVGIPLPPDGLAAFASALAAQGVSEKDLGRMMKENPARLLGLPLQ